MPLSSRREGQQGTTLVCPGEITLSLASLKWGLCSWNLWGLIQCQLWGQEEWPRVFTEPGEEPRALGIWKMPQSRAGSPQPSCFISSLLSAGSSVSCAPSTEAHTANPAPTVVHINSQAQYPLQSSMPCLTKLPVTLAAVLQPVTSIRTCSMEHHI